MKLIIVVFLTIIQVVAYGQNLEKYNQCLELFPKGINLYSNDDTLQVFGINVFGKILEKNNSKYFVPNNLNNGKEYDRIKGVFLLDTGLVKFVNYSHRSSESRIFDISLIKGSTDIFKFIFMENRVTSLVRFVRKGNIIHAYRYLPHKKLTYSDFPVLEFNEISQNIILEYDFRFLNVSQIEFHSFMTEMW